MSSWALLLAGDPRMAALTASMTSLVSITQSFSEARQPAGPSSPCQAVGESAGQHGVTMQPSALEGVDPNHMLFSQTGPETPHFLRTRDDMPFSNVSLNVPVSPGHATIDTRPMKPQALQLSRSDTLHTGRLSPTKGAQYHHRLPQKTTRQGGARQEAVDQDLDLSTSRFLPRTELRLAVRIGLHNGNKIVGPYQYGAPASRPRARKAVSCRYG